MTANPTAEAAVGRLTQRVKDRTGTLSRSPIVDDVALILADHATQAARIAELEGKLGEVLAATTQGLSGQWVFDHEDPEALLSGANDVLSATQPAAPAHAAWKPTDLAVYTVDETLRLRVEIVGPVEGWWEVRHIDGSTAIVRPSRLAPFADRVAGEAQ